MTEGDDSSQARRQRRLSARTGSASRDAANKQIFASALRRIMAKTGQLPVLVLDKDGTITHPRHALSADVAKAILDVLDDGAIVAIVSGAEMSRLRSEVFHHLRARTNNTNVMSRLFFVSENGAHLYRYDARADEFDLVYRVELREVVGEATLGIVLAIIDETMERFDIARHPERGQVVADGSQIKFSPLGGIQDDDLRKSFDPSGGRRSAWAEYIRDSMTRRGLTDDKGLIVDVRVAGTASINILPRGINKGHAIDRLTALVGLSNDSVVYFGDKLGKDGNDADVISRACAVVNVGNDAGAVQSSTLILTAGEKGPDGVGAYLAVAHQAFREFNERQGR
jgi:HAD superfamily hydrolase (TIGR01484 family)